MQGQGQVKVKVIVEVKVTVKVDEIINSRFKTMWTILKRMKPLKMNYNSKKGLQKKSFQLGHLR